MTVVLVETWDVVDGSETGDDGVDAGLGVDVEAEAVSLPIYAVPAAGFD